MSRAHNSFSLYLLEDALLEFTLNLLAILVGGRLAVQRHQGTQVELGRLEQLNLADVHLLYHVRKPGFHSGAPGALRGNTYVLEGVDALGRLLNLAANDLGDELGDQLLQAAASGLALDDLDHLLADGTDLGGCGVGGLLDLVWAALGEGNSEEAEQVVVGGLDGDVGLDQRLPLAHERAQLVRGEVQAVEVGQAVLALDLVHAELDLAERVVLILLEIGQGHLDDAALQGIVGVLETGGAVDEGLADTAGHLLDIRRDVWAFGVGARTLGR